MYGDVFRRCTDLCGDIWRGWQACQGFKNPAGKALRCCFGQGYGNALAGLDQIQFDGPFDSRPASLDIEFTVDALGMSADCA